MPRIRKFNNHKFRGNKYSKNHNQDVQSTPTDPRPRPTENSNIKTSSSSKKINNSKLPKLCEYRSTNVNLIVDLEQISKLISSFTKCKFCDSTNCIELRLDEEFKCGLVHRLVLRCNVCNKTESEMTSKCVRQFYELNLRYAYALRSIGKGVSAGNTFSALMNISPPSTKFEKYNSKLLLASTEVCEASLRNAAMEAIEENEGSADVAAAFDGTWQKKGYTSINGVVTVTSFDTGKVLDFECFSKHCNICINLSGNPEEMETHKNSGSCASNYEGTSGGMEVVGAKTICKRSENKLGLRYTRYLGDGDSKGFSAVLESKPYGQDIEITKLECVGHVQKRVGTRLRRLKKTAKGEKLKDGKPLGGKGRLTDDEIDQLQRYYGLAIRNNLSSVHDMRKAIWATFYHKMSTDEKPQHDKCPDSNDTWCKYKKALQTGKDYSHKTSLPEAVMEKIKPVYEDLSKINLLQRCLHGKTQNPNESLNGVIWQRLPKTVFVGHKTLKLGVTDAVLCFNEGSVSRVNVLERLGFEPGRFMVEGLKKIDEERIKKADKETREESKKKRIRRRLLKRKREDSDCGEYCPGGF